MDSQEYDKLAREIVKQLEQINRCLEEAAKKRSKLQPGHSDNTSNICDDIPGTILALANEMETVPSVQPVPPADQRSPDPPTEEDIDSFLDAVRSRPSGNRAQRQGSTCSDISTIASKTIAPRPPPVDLPAMVERLRQAIALQAKIEKTVPIGEIDLPEIHQLQRERWLEVGKVYQNISALVSEFKAQVQSTNGNDPKQPAIIRDELVDCMKRMQSVRGKSGGIMIFEPIFIEFLSIPNIADVESSVFYKARRKPARSNNHGEQRCISVIRMFGIDR